jgi:xanthine/CO dehydrogenase XdhC/CoxF family maturation factor
MTSADEDPSCAVAHGTADDAAHGFAAPGAEGDRLLVAVFAAPVAAFLLRYAADAGYRTMLVEPDPERALAASGDGTAVEPAVRDFPAGSVDVVVCDHHRPELGLVLRDALATQARWIGLMGNPRVPPPHVPALTALGVPEEQIKAVHRPIGLNIGSRTPPEIAIATLAGLIADRNGRPGGFTF